MIRRVFKNRRFVVVVALGGLLIVAVTLFPYYAENTEVELRDAQRREDLRNLKLYLTVYHLDHKRYPERLEDLIPDYVIAVPRDPRHGDGIAGATCAARLPSGVFTYRYVTSDDKKKFTLQSCLEAQDKVFLVNSYE